MILFTLLACVAMCFGDQEWEDYKLEFGKVYSAAEEPAKYALWKQASDDVLVHNVQYGETFTEAVNEYSDMTDEEFKSTMLGAVVPEGKDPEAGEFIPAPEAVPNTVDWRQQGYVTPVKNQGRCGSCYSFSATGALEGAWFKKTGQLISISEQTVVDCSGRYGNYGCRGGWYQSAWKYLRDAGGDEREGDYPYTARQGRCRYDRSKVVTQVKGFHDIFGEQALTQALAQVGPVSVAIDASHRSFQRYSRGVYYEPACSSRRLDHAVLAVGYGTEGGQDYYLVKNSWGARWGSGGYIKMARNRNNNCGIATKPSYPLV